MGPHGWCAHDGKALADNALRAASNPHLNQPPPRPTLGQECKLGAQCRRVGAADNRGRRGIGEVCIEAINPSPFFSEWGLQLVDPFASFHNFPLSSIRATTLAFDVLAQHFDGLWQSLNPYRRHGVCPWGSLGSVGELVQEFVDTLALGN
jgi:hypothetical protein